MRPRTRRLLQASAVALTLAAAGCVPSPRQAPAPTPTPRPIPAPAPTPAPTATVVETIRTWQDFPQTPGDWNYAATATGSAARYGAANSEAEFSLICLRANRTVQLVRRGQAPGALPIVIRTTSRDGVVTAEPIAGATPTVAGTIGASDPLLDAMAFSRGRFAVEVNGLQTLYLPAWPEVTRVIEDCR